MKGFMALTVGLLGFLAVDAYLEGTEIGEASTGAFGGLELLFIGAAVLLTTVAIVLLAGHYLLKIPYDDLVGVEYAGESSERGRRGGGTLDRIGEDRQRGGIGVSSHH